MGLALSSGTSVLRVGVDAASPADGIEAVVVLLAIAAVGLLPATLDRLAQSPKFGRLDEMLDRALGGQDEGDR